MKLICTLKNYIIDPEINLFAPEGTIVEVVQYTTGGILVVAQSVLIDNRIVLDYTLTTTADNLKFLINT